MCVCVYVCVCACMHAYVHMYKRACMHAQYVHTCGYKSTCIHLEQVCVKLCANYTHKYVNTELLLQCEHTPTYVDTYNRESNVCTV